MVDFRWETTDVHQRPLDDNWFFYVQGKPWWGFALGFHWHIEGSRHRKLGRVVQLSLHILWWDIGGGYQVLGKF